MEKKKKENKIGGVRSERAFMKAAVKGTNEDLICGSPLVGRANGES